MIATEFAFHAPTRLTEALELLERHGDGVAVLAGGMSLVPLMSLGLAHPDTVVSLNHVAELATLGETGAALRIGALVRHRALAADPRVRARAPLLAEAAASIGDVQVRNRGTLGGSLVHADPAADYLSVMRVLEARFHLQSAAGERWIDAGDFFTDVMTTALAPGELLTEVEVPAAPPNFAYSHQRLRRVEGAFPIATASVAIESGLGRACVGLGGVGPRPVLLDLGAILGDGAGQTALAVVGEAARAASSEALPDLHARADYRREMAGVLARRAVCAALEKL